MSKTITLRPYQEPAVASLERSECHALISPVGSGKTIIAIEALKRVGGSTLVIAPLRVIYNVWPNLLTEFSNMKFAICHGTKKQRDEALAKDADVVLINPEGLKWLFENYDVEFDNLIVDEAHKFKNPASKRFKMLKQNMSSFRRRWPMTATPATKNCLDLWAQLFIVDKGAALGHTVTAFRRRYAHQGGYMGRVWIPNGDAMERITEDSKHMVHRVSVEIEDNTLFDNELVTLPPEAERTYKKAKQQLLIELENAPDKISESAISSYSLMRQITNGCFYADDGTIVPVHEAKLEAVKELVESLQGNSLLLFFLYKHDRLKLSHAFPRAGVIDGSTSARETPGLISKFASGKIDMLLCHPASAGTGLDGMQHNCSNIAWYGLPDDFGLYEQGNGRIAGHRAEGKVVTVSHILAKGTVDEIILERLQNKNLNQRTVLDLYRGENNEV